MIANLILSLVFLFVLIKGAGYSIKYSSRIAKDLRLPEFVVSFFIVAVISVLPETTISILSALNGSPELGLGTLLGSNIMDLTFVFGIVSFFSSGGINVKSKILGNNFFYLILLLAPVILGFDGNLSRIDGAILIALGIIFFIKIYLESRRFRKKFNYTRKYPLLKSSLYLVVSLGILLIGAFYTVKFAINFASDSKVPEILIGMTILALGTCLPELFFSIKAVKNNQDELALGDILGTVITDATIVLGLVALISPFSYNPLKMFMTGGIMFLVGALTILFMRTNKTLSKIEGLILILVYVLFVFAEFFVSSIIG